MQIVEDFAFGESSLSRCCSALISTLSADLQHVPPHPILKILIVILSLDPIAVFVATLLVLLVSISYYCFFVLAACLPHLSQSEHELSGPRLTQVRPRERCSLRESFFTKMRDLEEKLLMLALAVLSQTFVKPIVIPVLFIIVIFFYVQNHSTSQAQRLGRQVQGLGRQAQGLGRQAQGLGKQGRRSRQGKKLSKGSKPREQEGKKGQNRG